LGNAAVEIVKAEAIDSENVFDAVCCGVELSATVTATLKVPALVGVPLNTPSRLRLIPVGSPFALQLYGALPPCAASGVLG
jgi:hypothetical protein